MIAGTPIPPVTEFLWPTLYAVVSLGHSGTIDEIVESTIGGGGFSEEQLAAPHGEGRESEVAYRCAWARTYLKGMGLLDNSQRGVWSTTELGRAVGEADIPKLLGEYRNRLRDARKANAQADEADELGTLDGEGGSDRSRDWKEQLIAILQGEIEPDQFERLARRLLLEAGFVSATVTGRSGDGGIDGIGLYRLSLVTFPVFFQCKRYKGTVGASAVRDFRGAMSGRGGQGLLITTGTFTPDARKEATRDGAPPVDLIDGDRLCDLLKDYELGVRCTVRQVEDVAVLAEFFADL
jgi:restriction system protein